jgi:hypothetical protein
MIVTVGRYAAWVILALVGCGPSAPPKSAADFYPASLWSLRAGGKHKWKRLEGETSDSAIYVVHTKDVYGRIALWVWKPSWPNDPDRFRVGLAKPEFFGSGLRWAITTTSVDPGEWLFRGKLLPAGAGKAIPAFVMVRTMADGARFVCTSWSTEGDEDSIDTELEGCRAVRVKTTN